VLNVRKPSKKIVKRNLRWVENVAQSWGKKRAWYAGAKKIFHIVCMPASCIEHNFVSSQYSKKISRYLISEAKNEAQRIRKNPRIFFIVARPTPLVRARCNEVPVLFALSEFCEAPILLVLLRSYHVCEN
jgi:hypothetical protein